MGWQYSERPGWKPVIQIRLSVLFKLVAIVLFMF